MVSLESILAAKYPAKAHARRVVDYIKRSKPDVQGVLYLEGQKTRMVEDNDEAQPFRYASIGHWSGLTFVFIAESL